MAAADDDAYWQRVQQVLESCFLALERGEPLDLARRCDGDESLAAEVGRLLQSAPSTLLGHADPADDRGDAAAPSSFGDFDLLRPIGRGGMGRVYLANQRSLSRQVALKLLDQVSSKVPSAPLRLRREAELTALLDHPNIVPVYAVGEVDGVPFIAMKYLGGPSLAEIGAALPPERVARYGAALARALECAHAEGIVHRDVKPANVLLDGDVPVFVDFGLARSQADPTLTQHGKVAGTLRYMAPERFDSRSRVLDPRVDIYGLGATLYELLSARPPFDDDNPTSLVRSVLTRDPQPLRLTGRHHDLETIVLRAMAKEPDRRFATAAAMAEDLERYLAQRPVQSRRLSVIARGQRLARRHPRTSLAAAIALLLLATLTTIATWQHTRTQDDRTRRLAQARDDLQQNRHDRAAAALALLAASHPGDPEIARWLARGRAEVAFDEILVAAMDRSENVPASLLDDLTAAAAVTNRTDSSTRAPALAFAGVLATRHAQGLGPARERLDALPANLRGRRCGVAFAAWLDDAPLPWSLPAPTADRHADEIVFTAAVLRLAGAPPDSILEELGPAEPDSRAPSRRLFLEAIARADRGDVAAALQLLRGMADDDSPPPLWRWIANLQLQLGNTEAAHAAMQRAERDRSPAADYLRLAVAKARGDEPGFTRLFAAASQLATPPPEIERFLAEHAALENAAAIPTALQRLQSLATRQQHDRIGHDLTTAAAIQLAASSLPTRTNPEADGHAPEQHRDLVQQWQARAASLRYQPAAALADSWIARSLCHTDRPADLCEGLDLFAAACRLAPTRCAIAVLYAETVADLPEDVDGLLRVRHLQSARSALAATEALAARDLQLPTVQAQFVNYYAFLLALQAQDHLEVAARLPLVEDLAEEPVLARARDAAATARHLLHEPQRR